MSAHLGRRDVKKGRPGGKGWYAGSQNISAAVYAAAGDYRWLVSLCQLWEAEGLLGSELGSPGAYHVVTFEAVAVALADAREARDRPAVQVLARALRAVLAWDALVAAPGRREQVVAVLAGEPDFQGVPDPQRHSGIICAVSGMRWQHNRQRRRWHAQEQHGELLASALGLGLSGPILRALANRQGSTVPAAVGLSDQEASVLAAVVLDRNVEAARTAASWLLPYGVLRTAGRFWGWELRRTEEGVDSLWQGTAPNGNKPCHPYGWFRETDGTWGTLRPSFARPSKVTAGFAVEVQDGYVVARVAPQCGEEVRVRRLDGRPLWAVLVRGGVVTFNGEPVAPGKGEA